MSVFRRSFYGEDPTFTNLFRMLNDFETYSREVQTTTGGRNERRVARFNPRFDVHETEKTYELHGELPGIDRENVSIEFSEPQTMVIHGRIERNYSSGSPNAIEDTRMTGAITEGAEDNSSHKATVSDEETEAAKEKGETTSAVQVANKAQEKLKPQEHYWHQERSIGEFTRTFTFNRRVDDSAVSASLENGILHVTVPKASKPETRRIAIN